MSVYRAVGVCGWPWVCVGGCVSMYRAVGVRGWLWVDVAIPVKTENTQARGWSSKEHSPRERGGCSGEEAGGARVGVQQGQGHAQGFCYKVTQTCSRPAVNCDRVAAGKT